MKKTWISSAHRGFVKEGMHENTLSAFYLAAQKGADMIETDARMTADGLLVANHMDDGEAYDQNGKLVTYYVSKTDSETLMKLVLAPNDPYGAQHIPTLEQVLHLAYFTGMRVNIDLKEGSKHVEEIAKLVCKCGMRGRVVYATNGACNESIPLILKIDPDAKFIDTLYFFTAENLARIPDFAAKCYAFTQDFSDENIAKIRESGCMLATIGLNEHNLMDAFRHHPDMAEYPHTSDFEWLDNRVREQTALIACKPTIF